MDLAAAADGAGGDADPVGGFNAGIDVGHVSRSKGSGARTGFPDVEHRPSLRRYYPDQVRRVADYSALNLRLRARLPGDGVTIAVRGAKGKGEQPVRRASQTRPTLRAMPAVRRVSTGKREGPNRPKWPTAPAPANCAPRPEKHTCP